MPFIDAQGRVVPTRPRSKNPCDWVLGAFWGVVNVLGIFVGTLVNPVRNSLPRLRNEVDFYLDPPFLLAAGSENDGDGRWRYSAPRATSAAP